MASRKSIGIFDKKIQKLKETIQKKEDDLKGLREQLKEMENEKRQKEIEDLRDMIAGSDKSLDDIRTFITGK